MQNTRTVEVYLPWSNTWFNLPTLPTFTDDDGAQYNITDAHIFSMLTTGGFYKLYLVGGEKMMSPVFFPDWSKDLLTAPAYKELGISNGLCCMLLLF